MTTGGERLESVTQRVMLNGANAAVLLKSNGEPEVLQFRDVAMNPDGSFTLTGLLLGRRGTDVFAHGHQPGELFVLLDADDVETLTVPLGELGLAPLLARRGFRRAVRGCRDRGPEPHRAGPHAAGPGTPHR